MTVQFAKRLFLIAGVYGVLVVAPLFFLEGQINERYPPAVTHPEFYYGFACVTLAWQFVYLIMSHDPVRYRPMILPAVAAKGGFALSVFILVAQGRLEASSAALPAVDVVLAGLFVWAFFALGRHPYADHPQRSHSP